MNKLPSKVDSPRKRIFKRIFVRVAAISFGVLFLKSFMVCGCFSGGYSFKAKRVEAKVTLRYLHDTQQNFYLKNGRYGTLDELGANLHNEKNYRTQLELSHDRKNFTAIATSGRGEDNGVDEGCPAADIWLIDKSGMLQELPDLMVSETFHNCVADN